MPEFESSQEWEALIPLRKRPGLLRSTCGAATSQEFKSIEGTKQSFKRKFFIEG
jgi:hypothetical protein